jgi:hypothetical protein
MAPPDLPRVKNKNSQGKECLPDRIASELFHRRVNVGGGPGWEPISGSENARGLSTSGALRSVLSDRQITHRPIQPCGAEPGLPRSLRLPPQPVMRLRIHWLRRRPCFELPRNSALQLLPAMEVRGDSNLASFSAAGGDMPSLPGLHAFLLRLPLRTRLSPHPARSGVLPATYLRGDSKGAPFGGADGTFPGCPVPRSFGIAEDQCAGRPASASSGAR